MGWEVKPFNAAAGAIVVGIMTLPLVSSLCEDALAAVPKPLREGAYGIGSTKFEVIKKIVVPAALSGIMASFILALSRAIGETMAVTLAAGQTPNLTMNPGEDIQTMTAYIVNVSSGDAARGTAEISDDLRCWCRAVPDDVLHEHPRAPRGQEIPEGVLVSHLNLMGGTTAHSRGRQRKDAAFKWLCVISATLAAIILACVLVKIFSDGAARVNIQFLTGKASELFPSRAGILPALAGSAWIICLTILISVPIGVGSAIYLEEFSYKRNRFTDIIEINIANLSGVPSIIYGLLGLAVFSTMLGMGRGILVGALTMTLLVLPMVILVSREALKAVPNTLREGALALGATRWQMIHKTVLPAALPGVLTGLILSVSRAMGEVAPLIVVGAVGMVTFLPERLGDDYTVPASPNFRLGTQTAGGVPAGRSGWLACAAGCTAAAQLGRYHHPVKSPEEAAVVMESFGPIASHYDVLMSGNPL